MDQRRRERIERLLEELRYEVTVGILAHEIEEHVTFGFIVPRSQRFPKHGVVCCEFTARSVEHPAIAGISERPRLSLVAKK